MTNNIKGVITSTEKKMIEDLSKEEKMQVFISELKTFYLKYTAAMNETATKIEILNEDFKTRYNHSPIEHIETRIKEPESLIKKMLRNNVPFDLSILENQGCDARVLQMEGAKDPDEYVIKYGSGRFNLLVENAISLVEFKIKMLKSKYNLENAKDKIRFLKEITQILSGVENKIEREIYIDNISSQYNISKEAIYAEVNKSSYNAAKNENALVKPVSKPKKEDEISPAIIKRENMIIYLLINHFAEAYEPIVTNIGIEDFKLEENKTIFKKILESTAEDSEKIVQIIANIEDERIQSHVSQILVTDYEINSVDKCIEDVVTIYNKERLNNRKFEIIKALENSDALDKEDVAKLEQELSNIIVELAKKK